MEVQKIEMNMRDLSLKELKGLVTAQLTYQFMMLCSMKEHAHFTEEEMSNIDTGIEKVSKAASVLKDIKSKDTIIAMMSSCEDLPQYAFTLGQHFVFCLNDPDIDEFDQANVEREDELPPGAEA